MTGATRLSASVAIAALLTVWTGTLSIFPLCIVAAWVWLAACDWSGLRERVTLGELEERDQ